MNNRTLQDFETVLSAAGRAFGEVEELAKIGAETAAGPTPDWVQLTALAEIGADVARRAAEYTEWRAAADAAASPPGLLDVLGAAAMAFGRIFLVCGLVQQAAGKRNLPRSKALLGLIEDIAIDGCAAIDQADDLIEAAQGRARHE